MLSKIGVGGGMVLALLFFFVLVPWHKDHDPKEVSEQSIFTTWWQLGQPTRPTKVTQSVTAPTAVPATTASVATTPVSTGKSVTSKVTPKAQGPKKTPTLQASKPSHLNHQPQPDTGNIDMASAIHSAFAQ